MIRSSFGLCESGSSPAIIGDVLDLHGYRNQFLPPSCRPLRPDMVVCGRAMTVLEMDEEEASDPPFGLMLKALDSLQQNEVYVAAGGITALCSLGGTDEHRSAGARRNGRCVSRVHARHERDSRHGLSCLLLRQLRTGPARTR